MDAPSSTWKQRLQVLHQHLTLNENAGQVHVHLMRSDCSAEPSVWHDVPQVLRLSKALPRSRLQCLCVLPGWQQLTVMCMLQQCSCLKRYTALLCRHLQMPSWASQVVVCLLNLNNRWRFRKMPGPAPTFLLGNIAEAFKKDTSPQKLNLGVGAYRTEART